MKTSDLSIKELAAFIRVSTDTIRRAVRKGEIPATRVGTAYRFDLHQVRHQMERGVRIGDILNFRLATASGTMLGDT